MTRPCLPPLSTFTPPSFALPPGACDCHAHVFGPFKSFPLANERSYTPAEFPGDAFIAHLQRMGFSRGVLVTGSACGTENGSVLNALARFPEKLRGVAVPQATTTDAELDSWHAAGIRGARFNLFQRDGHKVYRNGVGLEVLEKLAPRMSERGWHAQIWIHAPDLIELAPRLLRLGLPLVIDHMGRMSAARGVNDEGFLTLCRMLAEGKAWAKISGADRNTATNSDYADIDPFALALLNANSERVIWGSDWPHINYFEPSDMPDDGQLLNLLARWLPDSEQRRKILVDNPELLYGFPSLGKATA